MLSLFDFMSKVCYNYSSQVHFYPETIVRRIKGWKFLLVAVPALVALNLLAFCS